VDATCKDKGLGMNSCQCNKGYEGNGTICSAINMCLKPAKGACHKNGTCVYMGPGLHECRCAQGFKGNGVTDCSEMDVCDPYLKACSPYSSCARNPVNNTASCSCNEGYSGDGQTCVYVDKCAANSSCSADAVCINSGPGAARCKCKYGFKGDGKECAPIAAQQCSKEERVEAACHTSAACVKENTPDGPVVSCKCEHGWTGTGMWCEEINPCRSKKYGNCNRESQECIFMGQGNFRCDCLYGNTVEGDCEDPSQHPRVIGKYQMNVTNMTWVGVKASTFKSLLRWDLASAVGMTDALKADHAVQLQNIKGNSSVLPGGATTLSFEVVVPLEYSEKLPVEQKLLRLSGAYIGDEEDGLKVLMQAKYTAVPIPFDAPARNGTAIVADDCVNGCAIRGAEM